MTSERAYISVDSSGGGCDRLTLFSTLKSVVDPAHFSPGLFLCLNYYSKTASIPVTSSHS